MMIGKLVGLHDKLEVVVDDVWGMGDVIGLNYKGKNWLFIKEILEGFPVLVVWLVFKGVVCFQ